jgi:tryptophan-rich sensory protein
MNVNDVVALIVALAACFAAAGVGAYATSRSLRSWYVTLPKPRWNPPNWVFGPVWTLLYFTMAISAWLVWLSREGEDVAPALAWFATQLVLNVLWSVAFFGLRSPVGGLVVIVGLWWAIAATAVAFAPLSGLAAAMLVPYLLWVSFAMALNGAIAGIAAGRSRG